MIRKRAFLVLAVGVLMGTLPVRNLPAGGGVEFSLVLPAAGAGDG